MRSSTRKKPQKTQGKRQKRGAKSQPNTPEQVVWDRLTITIVAAVSTVSFFVFLWSYWPTVVYLVDKWNNEPDYSHGFLVVPLAIFFLWIRRQSFPDAIGTWRWMGAVLIVLSIALRWASGMFFATPVDGWSMLLWISGVVCLFGGWPVLKWALPAVLFLWFAIPLPFRAERMLSLPLQHIATQTSTWILQCFGQPALNEGTTIVLGHHHLEIERACSGLRIFMGVIALAFAFVIITRRSLWEKAILLGSVVPIALLANAIRIVGTAFLYQYASSETAKKISHDMAGWGMIPLAAAMFAFVVWYVKFLVPEVPIADTQALVRKQRAATAQ